MYIGHFCRFFPKQSERSSKNALHECSLLLILYIFEAVEFASTPESALRLKERKKNAILPVMLPKRPKLIGVLLVAPLLLLLGGCRYRAGFPVDSYNIKTIYVKPTVKEALTAQLSGELTRQLGEEILRNGFLRLAPSHEADATLETTITNYSRGISVVDEDDDEKAKSLSLSATCKYTLRDNRDGTVISNGSVSSSVGITATTHAQAIEYQRAPQLTRALAKQIASQLLAASGKKITSKAADTKTDADTEGKFEGENEEGLSAKPTQSDRFETDRSMPSTEVSEEEMRDPNQSEPFPGDEGKIRKH